MRLTLPLPPSANRNWKTVGGGGGFRLSKRTGKLARIRQRTVLSDESKKYRESTRQYLLVLRLVPLTGPLVLTARVYRPSRARDLNNTGKILLDSLEGFAYRNDNQIVEEHWYADDTDPKNPRVELTISRLDQAP
jgi:Holliday junction resolvase RusA-like endonuclease